MFVLYHFMPVPVMGTEHSSGFSWGSLLMILAWLIPFAIAYFWHLYHDHKHNHHLDKKLDEIAELLKKILEKK